AVNGVPLANPIIKDSTDIHPMMGTLFIEFVAQWPGEWPYHCHLWPHSQGGMFMYIKIV
ncbi:MAG: multicopper oxidase domain-containing protein, partial [Candidatus Entotheonellia bacterium]